MNNLKIKLLLFCYNIILIVILSIYLLWLLIADRKKFRTLCKANFSYFFKSSLLINMHKPYIWFHAASIGESKQIFSLVGDLLDKYKDNYSILVTTCTESSQRLWQNAFGNNITYCFLPWDIKFITKRFIRILPIKLAIFVESDFWPNILFTLKEQNISVLLINGRISDKSYKGWLKIKNVFAQILKIFSFIGADSEKSCKYFEDFIGKGNVKFFGNLKYVQKYNFLKNNSTDKDFKEIIKDKIILVALSTHEPEEVMIGKLHLRLKDVYPNLLTILIPRHIKRNDSINSALQKLGLNTQLLSSVSLLNESKEVYIVDSFGEISDFIACAQIVYIGKSMYKSAQGGHNLLEPMSLSKPVIFGPYMNNFKEIYEEAIKNKAAIMVDNPDELYFCLKDILNNISLLRYMGLQAKKLSNKVNETQLKYLVLIENYLNI